MLVYFGTKFAIQVSKKFSTMKTGTCEYGHTVEPLLSEIKGAEVISEDQNFRLNNVYFLKV